MLDGSGILLAAMVKLNKARMGPLERFKQLIEEYNKGLDADTFFAKLLSFTQELSAEEKRGVSEQLTEEELAVFDILMKPEIEMTPADKKKSEGGRSAVATNPQAGQVGAGLAEETADAGGRVLHGQDGARRPTPDFHAGTVPREVRRGVSTRLRQLSWGRGKHLRVGINRLTLGRIQDERLDEQSQRSP